ncbi:F-box protein: endocytic membrane traffic, recycling ReCYcling 1 [Terramyces sp. JEL0728]|nr:F-box protein: endocytic membrane traffic, recycling ReCYcling 1 [Terramyces sp. JEL0728]
MKMRQPPKQPPNLPQKQITALPPDIVSRIFSLLPVPEIVNVACVCRRFKVLAYNNEVYEWKLHALGMSDDLADDNMALKDSLAARLRKLPGGQYLPAAGKHLLVDDLDKKINEGFDAPSITAALPDAKASHLIIGAGGLKAALANASKPKPEIVAAKQKKFELKRPAREAFKRVYMELYPYYVDFKDKSNDSLLFRDYKDLSEIGAILAKLVLFDKCKFLVRQTTDISFGLKNTVEWFESLLLGQFDEAFDGHNIEEMKKNAHAAFQLNGGLGCVNVFISKNPVFFDHTYNPTLLASKLPTISGPSVGYLFADEFAKFMDHTLANCKIQADLISQVFDPSINALTLFINKVFEDSISEYLTSLLVAAKSREGLGIYLHTLATSVYCCSQFVDFIAKTNKEKVDATNIKKNINDIFSPYVNTYLDQELEHLKKNFKNQLEKWDNRKSKDKKKGDGNYLNDAEKASAHKNKVMNTMKAIMFAPVALTSKLVGGGRKSANVPLLNDSDPIDSSADLKDDTVTYQLDDDSLNSLVSLELSLHLMHANKESLGRALVITASSDMTKLRPAVQKIFICLLKAVGEKHLKPAFAIAIDRLNKSVPADFGEGQKMINMDSLQFFDLIHMGDVIQQMVDVYYAEDIRLWIDENDFLSDIIIEKKAFERLLDDSVAAGMDKAIQVLINQCEFLLISGHAMNDYNPNVAVVFDFKPTKACSQVVQCLETHVKVLKGCIEQSTMEVFLGEVSVRLFHDMNKYYDWAYSLRLNQATKMFQALKELGNLFLADGSEELRGMVHDLPRFNGALRIEEIYELLQSRVDYKQIRAQVEAKDCIIQ